MKVYKYWAEPMTADDARQLNAQLRLAADYRRELALVENRARVLQRATVNLLPDEKAARRKEIRDLQNATNKALRSRFSTAGLAWGTYQAVEEAMDHSQRTTKFFDDVSTHAPRDVGTVAVHIQNREVNAASLVGGSDTFVRIGGALVGKPKRNGTTGAQRLRELWVRVGSNGREPIWAKFYVLMHRPLPAYGLKWLRMRCRRTGLRYRWEAIFVVDEPAQVPWQRDVAHTAGIDIGWRKLDDGGIRVAYWYGTDGAEGSLVIPEVVTRRDGKSDSLRAIRDRECNAIRDKLVEWRKTLPDGSWFVAATEHAHAWRKIGRFVVLHREWAAQRFDGDAEMFDAVAAWLKQDRHLYAWEAHNRRRQSLQVEGRVRQLAVMLAKRYATVAVEAPGVVPGLVKKDENMTGEQKALRAVAAQRMHACSPALVRRELKTFSTKYGATLIEVDPAFTTKDCAHCGEAREIKDAAELLIACNHCGHEEDQDRTAARNLVTRAAATGPTEGNKLKLSSRRTRKKAPAASTDVKAAS